MLNRLNADLIEQKLAQLGQKDYKVVIFEELDSTNTYALNNLAQFANNSVIVCENQSAGTGRNGKIWSSRPYVDLSVSFIHKFTLDFNYELLPLVIAVAVNRLFKQLRVSAKIKWPNDIWLPDNTKVAGILLSAKIQTNCRYIVAGIGLNNIHDWERNQFLADLIMHVEQVLSEYKIFGFATIRREWLDNCIHYHKKISLYQNNKLLDIGIHIDLASDGKIVLKSENTGSISKYNGSAISLIVEKEV
ncbi:MAG: biotin--[acetyl-CoA-carboxylase] ligase [Burkholderiales bacterium]|jgi:BirA family biotin operon repressor/biotin-[acetyl-CoA-carboxylase] ligase|nr:biotin--[acetyl-CoA-carboxylase] ligase [Burkholderiales bacterium]